MTNLLYKDMANVYDLIYKNKNYSEESKSIIKLILEHKKSKGKELLELACGTGRFLEYFEKRYNCHGSDLNKEMIAIAKKRLKKTKLSLDDMIDFKFNKKYDIILILFSSIAYAKTKTNLLKTIKNCYQHLNEGGLLIIDSFLSKKTYNPNRIVNWEFYEDKEKAVFRYMGNNLLKKDFFSFKAPYFILNKKKGTFKNYIDTDNLGLFEIEDYFEIFRNVKFKKYLFLNTEGLKNRGRYLAIK